MTTCLFKNKHQQQYSGHYENKVDEGKPAGSDWEGEEEKCLHQSEGAEG